MVTTSLPIVYGYIDNFCAFSALIASNCSSVGNSTKIRNKTKCSKKSLLPNSLGMKKCSV